MPTSERGDQLTRIHPRVVQKALRKSLLIDSFLCCRFSFSPYMACGHGCAYCDGRAEKYWVEGDFERDIVVRRNLPGLLTKELPKLRECATVAIGSGISDAYQPVEKEEGLMRECAAILADSALPVSLLTKSSLVCRDIDLWERAGAPFILNMTIATLDETVRARFEPRASRIQERLETLREFRRRGMTVGVMAMPLLPFLSDGEEEIRTLVRALKDAGASFVMPAGLTLRPGRQKDFFMKALGEHYPGLVGRYREIYAEERPSGVCTRAYRDGLSARIEAATRDAGVPFLLPHALYRNRVPLYDELHLLLRHMMELYTARHVPTAGLAGAARRYEAWLSERKRIFNRKRSLRQENLEEETRALFESGSASDVLGNAKLASFLGAVALERKVFDYLTLSLSAPAS
ncbi:MAG TPA: radical SAM protein [Spirochaetia bacterium]|nr:radical SAM protein [Spirochaetia bacterium]